MKSPNIPTITISSCRYGCVGGNAHLQQFTEKAEHKGKNSLQINENTSWHTKGEKAAEKQLQSLCIK